MLQMATEREGVKVGGGEKRPGSRKSQVCGCRVYTETHKRTNVGVRRYFIGPITAEIIFPSPSN